MGLMRSLPRSKVTPDTTSARPPTVEQPAGPSPHNALLRLQQSVGNRAVARQLERGRPPGTTTVLQRCGGAVHDGCDCASRMVQRYVEQDGARISTGKKMRVDGPRDLYATESLIASTAAQLEAANSFFTVTAGGPHPDMFGRVAPADVMYAVKVKWNVQPDDPRFGTERSRGTNRAQAEHHQLATMNQADPAERGKARVSSLFNADTELAKTPGIDQMPSAARPTVRVAPPSKAEIEATLGDMCTHRDCHRNAQSVAGSLSDDRETPFIKLDGKETAVTSIDDPRHVGGLKQTATHRASFAVLLTSLKRFPLEARKAITAGTVKDTDAASVEALAKACEDLDVSLDDVKAAKFSDRKREWGGTDNPLVPRLWALYQRIYDNPVALDVFSTAFGVNDKMQPKVGDMLTTINKDTEAGREHDVRGTMHEMWNFHYTGVLMTDGEDYVALEDFAGDYSQGAIETAHWFFRMYGPKHQSFWSHYGPDKDPHTGSSPLAVIMRPTPTGMNPYKR